jgi:hypothetical protein
MSSLLVNGLNNWVFQTDRLCGGGVCILLNSDIVPASPVSIPSMYLHVEIVAFDLLNCPTKTSLFVCYRPSDYDNDPAAKAYVVDLWACTDHLMPHNSTFIICGDLYLPSVDWKNIYPGLGANDTCVGIFLNALNQFAS